MSQMEIDRNGNKIWRNSIGQKHREDGPAVEKYNGAMAWYVNGKLHREDGPAVEYNNEVKIWYINGTRHREDGPALEYADGTTRHFLNDVYYTIEEFLETRDWPDAQKVEFYLRWKSNSFC